MENNIVYDLIMLEADRILSGRKRELDLYYKDRQGNMRKLGEAYDKSVDDLISQILKKKKMRYFITFVDALEEEELLKPSSMKILRFFGKEMTYGNVVSGWAIRDLHDATGINMNYIISAIGQLCEKDLLRFKVIRNRRTYMLNPTFYYKGSMRKIFWATKNFDSYPKRDKKLNIIKDEFKETIQEFT